MDSIRHYEDFDVVCRLRRLLARRDRQARLRRLWLLAVSSSVLVLVLVLVWR